MNSWKNKLSEIFPEIRKTFCLESEAAVGASHYWHKGVATGIILPIKAVKIQGHLIWQTPYQMTLGGRVDKYDTAEQDEIIVYPELKNIVGELSSEEPLAYLIAINPAPGLESAFEVINDDALKGLLAHELAEIHFVRQQPNYHHRISHHGLAEHEVDNIAAQKGYLSSIKAYLEFLMKNVENIREREEEKSILDLFDVSEKPTQKLLTDVCRAEIESRLNLIHV